MKRPGQPHPAPVSAPSSVFFPASAAAVLLCCAFSLSCRLPSGQAARPAAGAAPSAADKVADTAREAIAKHFYAQADMFFHRGVGHVKPKALEGTFFQRLSATVTPQEHVHLAGQAIKEIMPWLKFAMQADPHNTEFAVVAAFWLAGQGGRQDLAHEVLREARISNPRDCTLIAEQGRLFIRQGRFDDARRLLDLALRLWPGRLDAGEEDALRLKREILLYTALLAEESGNRPAAIADLRAVLAIYPDMQSLQRRIQNLENGTEPENSARAVLQSLIASADDQRGACGRETCETCGHEGHDHAEHDHKGHGSD